MNLLYNRNIENIFSISIFRDNDDQNDDILSGGFGDSNWENFFSGHADNVEKDIHSLARQQSDKSDDHTAPPAVQGEEDVEDTEEEERQPTATGQGRDDGNYEEHPTAPPGVSQS